MKTINVDELKNLKTLITNFMCDSSTNIKNYSELVAIFNKCYKKFSPDPSNDLRILNFEQDMKSNRWQGDIVLIQDKDSGLITDGIHRGIAFIRCIESGLNENSMPKLKVIIRHVL